MRIKFAYAYPQNSTPQTPLIEEITETPTDVPLKEWVTLFEKGVPAAKVHIRNKRLPEAYYDPIRKKWMIPKNTDWPASLGAGRPKEKTRSLKRSRMIKAARAANPALLKTLLAGEECMTPLAEWLLTQKTKHSPITAKKYIEMGLFPGALKEKVWWVPTKSKWPDPKVVKMRMDKMFDLWRKINGIEKA